MTQPYRFDKTHDAADVHAQFPDLEPGTETETVVTVAGRLMLRRVQGKLAFGTLQDATGRIQLFASAQGTPSLITTSAVKSLEPRMSDEPTP